MCRTLLESGTFGRMPCLEDSSSRQRFGASSALLTSATETGVHCLSWVASGLGPDSDRIESCLAISALVWSLGCAHGMGVCVAAASALGGDLLDWDGRGPPPILIDR